MRRWLAPALVLVAPGAAHGGVTLEVTAVGTVALNDSFTAPLDLAAAGDPVTLSFRIDSDGFLEDGAPTDRAYLVDPSTFTLAFPTFSVGLASGAA